MRIVLYFRILIHLCNNGQKWVIILCPFLAREFYMFAVKVGGGHHLFRIVMIWRKPKLSAKIKGILIRFDKI